MQDVITIANLAKDSNTRKTRMMTVNIAVIFNEINLADRTDDQLNILLAQNFEKKYHGCVVQIGPNSKQVDRITIGEEIID